MNAPAGRAASHRSMSADVAALGYRLAGVLLLSAAMASNSRPSAAVGCPAFVRAVNSSAANPAIAPPIA